MIWKHTNARTVKDKETGEEVERSEATFMKKAFFFTFDQTDPIITG